MSDIFIALEMNILYRNVYILYTLQISMSASDKVRHCVG